MQHMDDMLMDFPCSRCGALNKATIRDAREKKTIRCGSCGADFRLPGPAKSLQEIQADTDRMLAQLKEKFPF